MEAPRGHAERASHRVTSNKTKEYILVHIQDDFFDSDSGNSVIDNAILNLFNFTLFIVAARYGELKQVPQVTDE